jgi:chromosome partitioning protein
MLVISFISQKGGVGKSVLARLLATELTGAGYTTRIADLDVQQATSTRWAGLRLENGHSPAVDARFYKSVGQAIREAEGTDVLIFDGKPIADAQATEAARKSNLIVLPTGASLDDLQPAAQLVHALLKEGVPAKRILIMLVGQMTELTEADARTVLTNAGMRVAVSKLRKLPSYEAALGQGLSPTETWGKPGLRAEAAAVAEEIVDVLKEAK